MITILTVILMCLLIVAVGLIVFQLVMGMVDDRTYQKIQKKQLEDLRKILEEREE